MDFPRHIGRYDVVDKIGEGGMGILYLARDTSLGRPVALKVLSVVNAELRERFAREARSAASLKHQHIVTIYDIGEDQGRPFMAMEYLDGETMAELIRRGKAVPLARKLELMLELCNGLGYAHRAGLIHRDIKPANVMITTDGSLKILDFGLARLADQGSNAGLTQAGALIGTPHYMSPEQIEGKDLDHRSDIFAVGVVLYEFIGYRKAFPGDGWQAVLPKILHAQPQPLREFSNQLDPELEEIVAKAMAKKPDDRYPQLSAMANDLRRVLDRVRSSTSEPTVRVDRPVDDGGIQPRTPSPTPTHRPSLDVIAKRRAEQIKAHVAKATADLEAGNFESAIEQCEAALVIDPNDFRVLRVLDDAHRTLEDRRVMALVLEAEQKMATESLTAAAALIGQAQALRPEAPEVLRLQRALNERRIEQERRAENARAARGAIERGLKSEADEAFESAVRSANEALMYEPDNQTALELKRRASSSLAAQRAQERERRVAAASASARQLAANRDYDQAFRLLQEFPFPHEALDRLRDDLVTERDAYEEQLQEEAEAKRQAEEEARRRAEAEAKQKVEEQRKAEEEARQKAAEEAKRRAEEEVRLEAERAARLQAEEEERRLAAEEARLKAEADARLRAEDEARRRAEAEAKRAADEHAAAEARRLAAEEARREADEAKRLAEAEARRRAEDDAKRKVDAEARWQAQAEARRLADEAARREAEARLREEEEARRRGQEARRATPSTPLPGMALPGTLLPGTSHPGTSTPTPTHPSLPSMSPAEYERLTRTGGRPQSAVGQVPASPPHKPLALMAAAAVVLIAVLGGWWIATRESEPPPVDQIVTTPPPSQPTIAVPAAPVTTPPVSPPAPPAPNITVDATQPDRPTPDTRQPPASEPPGSRPQPNAQPTRPEPRNTPTATQPVTPAVTTSRPTATTSTVPVAPEPRIVTQTTPPATTQTTPLVPPGGRSSSPAPGEPVTPPPPTTPATNTPSTAEPTRVPETTRPSVPPPAPSMDMGTATTLLSNYAEVAGRLDPGALRRIYPRLPPGLVQRMEGLRRNFAQCEYRFSNPQITNSSPTRVTVQADTAESCKPKTAQRQIPFPPSRYVFQLVKDASGNWIFEDVFFQ